MKNIDSGDNWADNVKICLPRVPKDGQEKAFRGHIRQKCANYLHSEVLVDLEKSEQRCIRKGHLIDLY
jgi:hypothetical protein